MKRLSLLVLTGILIATNACSPIKTNSGSATTFVIVRHAEKGENDARDPSLSEAGKQRAQSLARLLDSAPVTAAYATGYQRTQQTAQPVAKSHGIVATIYDAQLPASVFASTLRASHHGGTVLVVGHSNTVPEIVAALSGTVVPPIADDEFDRLYRIDIKADGTATLLQDRY